MFTGIIEELGEVVDWNPTSDAARLTVRGTLAVSDASHGDSISVSGVCLTVIEQGPDWFTADVMAQTIAMSTLTAPKPGDRVNLERAAQVGDRLGGHIVQGHIDGTATLLALNDGSAWRVLRFSLSDELAGLVTCKGSIAVDGVSLTVSEISDPGALEQWFEVSLIPETLTATTLGLKAVGDRVNIETDILARHVERMLALATKTARAGGDGQVTPGSADQSPSAGGDGQVTPGSAGILGQGELAVASGAPETANANANANANSNSNSNERSEP